MKQEKNAGYKERFEAYLNGESEHEESRRIEADIEKFQVLMNHADQVLDQELFDGTEAMEEEDETGDKRAAEDRSGKGYESSVKYKSAVCRTDLSREISRVINRKFRRCIIAAAVFAVSIICVLLLVLSPLLDRIFYNPARTLEMEGETEDSVIVVQPFTVKMAVYMELFCADKGFADVSSWQEGYGRYTINVSTQIDGVSERYTLELVRNHLYQGNLGWKYSDFPGNAFTYGYGKDSCSIGKEEALKKLEGIPDSMKIRAAISFQDVKNMEELTAFMEQYETYYLYCPVVTGDNGYGRCWGFSPKYMGYSMTNCYDEEKYPYLDILQYEEGEQEITLGGVYEKHMESMIRYLMDDEEFLKIFDSGVPGENVADIYKYRAVLDYIRAHGVNCYGTIVYASGQELAHILDAPEVEGIYMLDGKIDMN